MKTIISITFFRIFNACLSSCNLDSSLSLKEHLNPIDSPHSNSFTGRDTLHCDNTNALEYDLTYAFLNQEYLTVDTILKSELGDSLYTWISGQISLLDSLGFEAWYLQLFGEYPSSDVVDELANLQTFAENNFQSNFYASLVDSIVDDYIADN